MKWNEWRLKAIEQERLMDEFREHMNKVLDTLKKDKI